MMLSTLKIGRDQYDLVEKIIAFYDSLKGVDEETADRYAKRIYRRSELKAANKAITGHTASPYFIAKNTAAQVTKKVTVEGEDEKVTKHFGYDLNRFVNYVAKHPFPAEVEGEAPTPKKKAKKKVAKKAVAKKRTKKAKEETPEEAAAATS